MVLSASSPTALAEDGNSYSYVIRQAMSAGIGLVAMVVISRIDYHKYKTFYKIAYWGSVVLLALVPIIGTEVNGAKRWIKLGALGSFQPSELAKIGLIVFYAGYLTNRREKLKTLVGGFLLPFLWIVLPIGILVLLQDHLSASIVIIAIVSVMMAKVTRKGNFRLDRIVSFLDPWADASGDGWQVIQSLYAIGSGGLFGVGLRTEQTKIFVFAISTQ